MTSCSRLPHPRRRGTRACGSGARHHVSVPLGRQPLHRRVGALNGGWPGARCARCASSQLQAAHCSRRGLPLIQLPLPLRILAALLPAIAAAVGRVRAAGVRRQPAHARIGDPHAPRQVHPPARSGRSARPRARRCQRRPRPSVASAERCQPATCAPRPGAKRVACKAQQPAVQRAAGSRVLHGSAQKGGPVYRRACFVGPRQGPVAAHLRWAKVSHSVDSTASPAPPHRASITWLTGTPLGLPREQTCACKEGQERTSWDDQGLLPASRPGPNRTAKQEGAGGIITNSRHPCISAAAPATPATPACPSCVPQPVGRRRESSPVRLAQRHRL